MLSSGRLNIETLPEVGSSIPVNMFLQSNIYGKCYKIVNTFLSLFSNKISHDM